MHELGIVFSIINSVENVAKENNVKHVDIVELEIGEVSTIVNSYLEDCWKWAVNRTEILKDCELKIDVIKAINICEDCGEKYSAMSYGRTCPKCLSPHTHIIQGTEVNIKNIMVNEDEEL